MKNMKIAVLSLLSSLLCLFVAPDVHAWGEEGHRVTGHIARNLLTDTTRASLKQLMGSDDLATFPSISTSRRYSSPRAGRVSRRYSIVRLGINGERGDPRPAVRTV